MALHLLLTPMLLAAPPATVTLPEMTYDHGKQMSVVVGEVQQAQWRNPTYNGTQTFMANGRPFDSDND
jgi:hypothetical protein